MKVVVQRAKNAEVKVDNKIVAKINHGFVLLVGFTHNDTIEDINYCAKKVANLRIFEDENHKMNLSLNDVQGAILSVSQFTLYSDTRKGNRPSFIEAARPEQAKALYDEFNDKLRKENIKVETGIFGAMMEVSLVNDGPVTIIIDSKCR